MLVSLSALGNLKMPTWDIPNLQFALLTCMEDVLDTLDRVCVRACVCCTPTGGDGNSWSSQLLA